MTENLLRKRLAQSHQENRPVYGMETDNVFSNQMQVCRPKLLILPGTISFRIITDAGNVICQRVQPYIDHMFIIEIHRNAPFKRSSGNAQIL